jgi:hypothetical protein
MYLRSTPQGKFIERQPDSSYRDKRGGPNSTPNFVIEVGQSDGAASLEEGAKEYLSGSLAKQVRFSLHDLDAINRALGPRCLHR